MKIDAIREGVLQAGEAVRKAKTSEGIVVKEGRLNFVTAADLESERILIETIRRHFPTHAILSEETESDIEDILAVEHLWVIDPIDGTSNFRYGRGYAGISVGYTERGEPQIGFIYNPFTDELFYAQKGEGAFVNDIPIQAGKETDLAKATVMTDNWYEPEGTRQNLETFLKIKQTPWILIRGSAVLAYCDIASARADLYFHSHLRPWDNAAGFVIAQEAGATIKGWNGENVDFLSPKAVAGNEALVKQFVEEINA